MRRLCRWLVAIAAASAAFAGVFPAAAAATVTNQTPPSIPAAMQVGARAICSPGTWTSNSHFRVRNFTYQWVRSTDLADPIHTGDRYVPTAADLGQQLICEVTATDPRDATTATADSSPSDAVAPLATVSVTHYSPALSGNLGEALAGVGVNVALVRSGITIAGAAATTDGAGAWSGRLVPTNPASGPPHGVGRTDVLTVSYSPPAGNPSALVPADFSYGGSSTPFSFAGSQSEISADGSSLSSSTGSGNKPVGQPCQALRFKIDGTVHVPTSTGGGCQLSPGAALTDQDHVQGVLSTKFGPSGGQAVSRTTDDVGLLGEGAGAPSCNADLVTGAVICNVLNGGQFAVSLNGGSPVALATSGSAPVFTGTATLTGLKAGDAITLDETSPTATTRHLTTLHLMRVRMALAEGAFVSGKCQPGELFSGGLCPPTGVTPAGVGFPQELFDDRSPGFMTAAVPSLTHLIPAPDSSLAGGTFTAYAQLTGVGTPAALNAETSSVKLTIRPHGSSAPVFSQDMTPTVDNDGTLEAVAVSGLSPLFYFADWVLTDTNGDTNAFETAFAVQSGGGI